MSQSPLVFSAGALMAGLSLLCGAGSAQAQKLAEASDTMSAIPRFAVLPATHPELAARAGGLTTWNYTWTYRNKSYNVKFVGNAPSGAAATIPSFIIPLKIVVAGQTFSTSTLQRTTSQPSPTPPVRLSFKALSTSRRRASTSEKPSNIDAFERENFWPTVVGNPTYHVLLGAPTVLPEVTLNVPIGSGSVGTEFGVHVALVDINYIDAQLQAILAANPQITGKAVPVFVAYNTYETQPGCCIGGYHSATGSQSYMLFDYIGKSGAFSQDVSALSHEMGEWLADPFTVNRSPCGIYENGDPLENEPNFGDYPYVVGLMTYHLQDLAQAPYFGSPGSTSLDGRKTFQGTVLSVCQNGA